MPGASRRHLPDSPMRRAHYSRVLALAGAIMLATAAGCNEAAAPRGTPGTVVVTAFVDQDASGGVTAGDQLLPGVVIALFRTSDSTEVTRGTTDASGRVAFPDIAPGSYRARAVSGLPEGAEIVSNPRPSAVIGFRGDTARVEFRLTYFPGSVSGRLYRNDDGQPGFDPAGDTPGGNVMVIISRDTGGTVPGPAIDTVITDLQGLYEFNTLAPGSYWLTFDNPGALDYGAEGQTRRVVVSSRTAVTYDVTFTGSFVIPIATARTRPMGSIVTVQGNITVPPARFSAPTANSEVWIQDATGGIAVFSIPGSQAATYPLGQRVEVTGQISAFNGQRQISAPTGGTLQVTPVAGGAIVAPRVITVAQARALTFEGQLVAIGDLEVVVVPTTGSTTAYNITAIAPGTTDTIQFRVPHASVGIPRSRFAVGQRISIIGIMSQFNGTPQIKVRYPDDVGIGAARQLPGGTAVVADGNVTVPPGIFTTGAGGVNSEIWVQDVAGGISVFSVPTANAAGIALGDRLIVTGGIGAFRGQIQIQSITGGPQLVVTRVGPGTAPAPRPVTPADAAAMREQGFLVTVSPLTVTVIPTGTGPAFTVQATGPGGERVDIRVSSATTGLTRASFVVGQRYAVTGVMSRFNAQAQVKPRYATDVVLLP